MSPFGSIEYILEEINEKGCYIWKPIRFGYSNRVLLSTLRDMRDEKLLNEKDVSTGFSIFKKIKISFTITEEGLKFINDIEKKNNMNQETEKFIYRPSSKITKETITIYGCGKFQEEQLVLEKAEAGILLIELYNFINQ